MVLDSIRILIADKDPSPNKFTIAMGELIRKAREESGMSQTELAKLICRRQATLSDIENGKTVADTSTLILLAAALEKTPSYFYPSFVYRELEQEMFTPLEQELLSVFQNIWSNHLRVLAIQILRTISKFDPEEMLLDSLGHITDRIDLEESLIETLEARKKREGQEKGSNN